MKTAEHTIRERAIHHGALECVAKSMGVEGVNGLTLWRKLRRLEGKATAITTALCNGEIDSDKGESELEQIEAKVAAVFGGKLPPGFFINRDPRGYALKLKAGSVPAPLTQDWGRYQILAPEIN